MYSLAREYIGDLTGKKVYDLYSGTGTIAQVLAPVAKEVTGVEIVEEAVYAAAENAKENEQILCVNLKSGECRQVVKPGDGMNMMNGQRHRTQLS